MKSNFLKSIFYLVLSIGLITSCANDDDYSIPSIDCNEPELIVTKTVKDIKEQATGNAVEYTNDDVIKAVVVSSDKGGNFYKKMYLNSLDGEIGFSLSINQPNLFSDFQPGRVVYIKLKNLFTQIRNNTLEIGALYSGNVGQIATNEYRNHIFRSCQVINETEFTNIISLTDVSDDYLGKLIRFEGVQFVDDAIGQNYYNPDNVLGNETNHLITDSEDEINTLIFRTGQYAEYAGTPVSSNSGSITGVLTKFGSTFQFIARYESDIDLTQERIGESPEEPGEPEEPEEPGEPEEPTSLLFAGADFENWATFNAAINSFGLQSYAVQGIGTGTNQSNSLHINGTPGGNDYVFTILASAQGDIPENPSKITFWVKGTSSAKSLSLNVYRSTSGYDVFNVGNLTTSSPTLSKAELNPNNNNGTNSYTGTINTNGQWVKVTLDISDVNLNTGTSGDIFALKVGSNSVYDLHIDNIEIE